MKDRFSAWPPTPWSNGAAAVQGVRHVPCARRKWPRHVPSLEMYVPSLERSATGKEDLRAQERLSQERAHKWSSATWRQRQRHLLWLRKQRNSHLLRQRLSPLGSLRSHRAWWTQWGSTWMLWLRKHSLRRRRLPWWRLPCSHSLDRPASVDAFIFRGGISRVSSK